jgi:hypothetical protein
MNIFRRKPKLTEITEDRWAKLTERHDQYWRQIGEELIKVMIPSNRYVALPGASRWTRIKVWFKNHRPV